MRIFTDGGCSGNPGPGGWAYVIVESLGPDREDTILGEAWGAEKNTTNNRMELMAVISALEAFTAASFEGPTFEESVFGESAFGKSASRKLDIYTDSQYVQKGMSQWIKDWKARSWRTAAKEPVKNQDLWQRLDALAAALPITWHWVKGHAGNVYNERCDSLTQKAIKSVGNKK